MKIEQYANMPLYRDCSKNIADFGTHGYAIPMQENLLDIDFLRSSGVSPSWFGLGFIQLKLDASRRMHFWHPEVPPLDDSFKHEYHNHRYGFTSEVLVGSITNHIFEIIEESTEHAYLYNVCCQGGGQEFVKEVAVKKSCMFNTLVGQTYYLDRDMFHNIDVSRCVTLQTRESVPPRDKAQVIRFSQSQSANPFSESLPEKRLWEIISDLLPPPPGYHVARIEKGILGEASKIREECLEFLDAHEQGAKVMELVELSDLLGAINAYLDKSHPGYTLDDLQKMRSLTERAFRNGHRS